jgi:GT2 family glycosyltransferase
VVAVSIVVYRSSLEHLNWACRALAAQTRRPEVVAVHINSASPALTNDVTALLTALDLPSTLTSSPENQGFSAAHNAALQTAFASGQDAVVVHNPDLMLAPNAVAEMAAAGGRLPVALLGPALELADPDSMAATGLADTVGIRWTSGGRHLDDEQGRPFPDLPPDPVRVDGISGACLFVSRAAYDLIVAASGEFFDEDFIAYREDAELAYRSALLGVHSYLVPSARGLHVRRLRGTARGVDSELDRLGVRNRFLIAAKYGRRRPGGPVGPWLRDLVVLGGVVARERSSWSGVVDAWRLRKSMRRKGAAIRAAAAARR